jgi:phosphoribosyl-AMP cyclohydrolase
MDPSTLELPLRFGTDGLVPAVIADATSGSVLMVGFMNEEALRLTRESGLVHFWSRSRQKMWLKGETSGHIQRVQEILVNCEENTLLIEVEQVGAVCHTGYPTCFYRRLEPDNSLTTIRDRWFDPEDVYGPGSALAATSKAWWGAFAYLRDNDLTSVSRTSGMLRTPDPESISARIAGELVELAGVLSGTHVHNDSKTDAALEGGQVCYWLAIRLVHSRLSWEDVRPDRALAAPNPGDIPSQATLARVIAEHAAAWKMAGTTDIDLVALARESWGLVAAALVRMEIDPVDVIAADLESLRSRPYLAAYFDDDDPA